jgi:outer membrane receptor protein involved in Fe transport
MLDAAYSDRQSGTLGDTPTFAIDSYTLVGARLGLSSKDQRWEAAVFGRNLTDEYYWTAVHNWGDAIVRYAGMPRTYGVEFTLNFD